MIRFKQCINGFQRIQNILKKTSSAGAEISDGPHKGGLRRAGPNDFMFVYHLIQKDLSMTILFVFIFPFVHPVFFAT